MELIEESQLDMAWKIVRIRGFGLNNTDDDGQCKNNCYINAIIQCLAYVAPFVQWLLTDLETSSCKLLNYIYKFLLSDAM